VSAIGGESELTELAQRHRGNGRLQGSEGVRIVRSRSDGGGPKGVRMGPRGVQAGPSGVRAVRSKSDGGKSDKER
jgi:hypothetical protein